MSNFFEHTTERELAIAILECLELANDHPHRDLSPQTSSILLRFNQALLKTLPKEGE